MQIIPVLDLLGGVVVRGIAGRREEYRPIVSRIVSSAEPIAVAEAFRTQFGLSTLYIADLDAIERDRPHRDVYASLASAGFTLLLDSGLRTLEMAREMAASCGSSALIAGLETCRSPQLLAALVAEISPGRILFSLDLHGGQPWRASPAWETNDPFSIATRAVEVGVQRMIVLDVAQVGVGGGPVTESLCSRIRARFPKLDLITGGGVRDVADLETLERIGVDGVLVASALHDGRLTRAEVECFAARTRVV